MAHSSEDCAICLQVCSSLRKSYTPQSHPTVTPLPPLSSTLCDTMTSFGPLRKQSGADTPPPCGGTDRLLFHARCLRRAREHAACAPFRCPHCNVECEAPRFSTAYPKATPHGHSLMPLFCV